MANDYFERFEPGEIREQMLSSFRESLRVLRDPQTGLPFTEDLIRLTTMQDARFWVEANDIDLVMLGVQRRSYFMAQQIDPRLSSTSFLENYHGPAAKLPRLVATGGSGRVSASGTVGTIFLGSTTIPNALAHQAKDKAGLRYQVYVNGTVGSDGTVKLTMVGIDTGTATNLEIGEELQWINPPAGADPKCSVVGENFRGGVATESDQDWGNRIFDARGKRPRAGNPAHFQLWVRRAINSVEQGFIYPCALNAGSVVVCVTQKRGTSLGPLARIAGLVTMTTVSGYLTPPGSPVVPPRVHVVAVAAVAEEADVVLKLALAKGLASGWAQATPWPSYTAAASAVNVVTDQKNFRISADDAPPSVGIPELMVWDEATSRFERLAVVSVVSAGGGNYNVVLSVEPEHTIAVGDVISPYTPRHASIAAGIEKYFDSLGPGEIVDLATDHRATRAFRRPIQTQSYPSEITDEVLGYISDSIGAPILGSSVEALSQSAPTIPVTASTGPGMLVVGNVGIYATS